MKNDRLYSAVLRVEDKLDKLVEKVHHVDNKATRIEGQVKLTNGQVARNVADIAGIKSGVKMTATKWAAGIGTLVTAIGTAIIALLKP